MEAASRRILVVANRTAGTPLLLEAVRAALQEPGFDEVIISTLPKRVSEWLRRDLPHKVEKLGVPVTTISQEEEREVPVVPGPMGRAA